jgi:DedD protein
MDQGLKERLVGAAVLVAIGVWLIPWVLDGPEAPLETGANSLQLPAAEEPMPMRTQTLRVGDDIELAAQRPTAVTPPAEPAATASVPAEDDARETSTAPDPASAPAPTPTPTRAAPTESRVAAVEPPKPAAAAGGQWLVQLGVFGEEANARRIAQRSTTFGYKADVSSYRSNGRTLYRVRVGSGSTRGQAEATASALRAHGLTDARAMAAEP